MKTYLRIIIMASGLSRRFGENKLLVEIDGKAMINHVLENVAQFLKKHPEKGTAIVVSSYDEILAKGRSLGLATLKNNQPELGQSESIKLGLSFSLNLDEKVEEVAVFLTADQPWMKAQTLEAFLLKATESESGFLCTSHKKIPGSPVSFREKYYPELLELQGDQGGKVVMKKHLHDVRFFEVDKDELKDVDCPEDLIKNHDR